MVTKPYLIQNHNKIPITKDNRPYQALGGALKAWKSGNGEVLLSGPAGTGKSRACLQKLHFCAQKYPGARILICRKTRKSITQTAMVTFEQKVLPRGWLDKYVHFSTVDQQYEYTNGSIIAVGGLDDPLKIMSSEWDMIYVQEATELRENDWEMLTTRLRNGVMPYQQLLADCNPSAPSHWLKKRADKGVTQMIESRHRDNPSVTAAYMAILNALTGVRKKRLRDGIWAAAEGMVYEDEWDPDLHIIDRIEIGADWPRYWSIDWGFRNPFVWQAWAEGPDGELYRYLEIYRTECLVEDMAKEIMELGEPRPKAIICDHDLEDRKTFEKHTRYRTLPANKAVSIGIQEVQSRLRRGKNGRAGMYFLRDSLIGVDKALMDKGLPYCTDQEFESYIWDIESKKIKEDPVKEFDHGCFIAGTLVTTDKGDIPIECIKSGDRVLTRDGYMPVKAAGMTKQNAKVLTVRLSNGETLTGTANHPIYVKTKGYIDLHAMRYGDIIMDINSYKERYPLLCQNEQRTELRQSSTKVLPLGVTPIRPIGQTRVTTGPDRRMLPQALKLSILKYGKMLTDLFQVDASFITGTAIPQITLSKIWNASRQKSMQSTMLRTSAKNVWKSYGNELTMPELPLVSGIGQKLAGNGTRNWARGLGRTPSMSQGPARTVNKSSKQLPLAAKSAIAPIIAKQHIDANQVLTMRQEPVTTAERNSKSTNTVKPDVAQICVLSVSAEAEEQDVYNLTVDNAVGEGEYFANGILVHNCDATRYMAMFKSAKSAQNMIQELEKRVKGAKIA